MQYVGVWLRGVRDIFSWHNGADTLMEGDLVRVPFRRGMRLGLVVSVTSDAPEGFVTKPVTEKVEASFVPPVYMELAHGIAEKHFCPLQKVLSLMVPEGFLKKESPVRREFRYALARNTPDEEPRGTKEKAVLHALEGRELSDTSLRGVASLATIKRLLEKGYIVRTEGNILPARQPTMPTRPMYPLTPEQSAVADAIWAAEKPVLLHGVTGSGKTEVYKTLVANMLRVNEKAQALIIVPEIALTPQLIAEFRSVAPRESLAVWHSHLTENERTQEWERLRTGQARVLIGARSAAMVPLPHVSLIIVDEEHEWTLKNEFSPRYHVREVVEFLARKAGAKCLMGSATPSLESFEAVRRGEYTLCELPHRVHRTLMPHMELINMGGEVITGNTSPISRRLGELMQETVARGSQVVLFLNRRGMFGGTFCGHCGERFHCPNCEALMKIHHHGGRSRMLCHICGTMTNAPTHCPSCGSEDFIFRGWGTQMVEKYLHEAFPALRVLRADADTIRGRSDFENLLEVFHRKEADILLGTQMIAKGLDFESVELVGILLADVGLSLPDFRVEERVFQLLTQVSGRAGRRKNQGRIVMQTFRPDDPIFSFVGAHDLPGFYAHVREGRMRSALPPFSSLVRITFFHPEKEAAYYAARNFADILQVRSKYPVLFAPAFIPRTHGKYHFHILLRAPSEAEVLHTLRHVPIPPEAIIDVNPVSVL